MGKNRFKKLLGLAFTVGLLLLASCAQRGLHRSKGLVSKNKQAEESKGKSEKPKPKPKPLPQIYRPKMMADDEENKEKKPNSKRRPSTTPCGLGKSCK